MHHITHGATQGRAGPQNESAWGYDTTSADGQGDARAIEIQARIERALISFASWLAVIFRGLI